MIELILIGVIAGVLHLGVNLILPAMFKKINDSIPDDFADKIGMISEKTLENHGAIAREQELEGESGYVDGHIVHITYGIQTDFTPIPRRRPHFEQLLLGSKRQAHPGSR